MSNITIDQLRALPDYAQVTKWDITFLTLPAIGPLGLLVSEALNIRCESVEIPKPTIQTFDVQIRGHKTVQPGLMDYGNTLTMTFTETVDNTILKLVKGWRELMWSSRQGRTFPKKDLEATLMIKLLDNQDNIRANYTVYGCMFQSADFGTMDSSTSDVQKPTLTLTFDFYIDTPLK